MDQAEGLRNIVKKQNQRPVGSARIIAVTSGKGGVGKSNTSINLALQFSRMGKKVIILDADFGLANIEVMFGVIPRHNLSDLMNSDKSLKDIIVEGPEGVGFISGGSGIAKMTNLDNEQVRRLVYKLSELEQYADIIIVDTGAGIGNNVLEFVCSCPEVILVTTPEPTSITDAYALLKALNRYPGFDREATTINVLCNRVNSGSEGINLFEKLNMVVGKFLSMELHFLGCIPMDYSITKAVMKQQPVTMMYPNCSSTKAYASVAASLIHMDQANAEQKPQETQNSISRFFTNLLRNRKTEHHTN
ncbi:MAG: MinD/ParA family protein [Lachnospiraceae bacterium]|nr:MinD/ParA family protein [Lachnospiraceae bacterium]